MTLRVPHFRSIPKLASESKVEVCAGDGQLTKAFTDYGYKGKAFDESWSGSGLCVVCFPLMNFAKKL